MIKYFIESPEGLWLTDPQFPEDGSLTDNPFIAWAFEELRAPLKWLYQSIQTVVREKYSWPIAGNTPGLDILSAIQEEECLKGYKITKQEFIEQPDGTYVHFSKSSYDMFVQELTTGQSSVRVSYGKILY